MTENEAIEILEERWRYSKTYKYTDAEIREAFDMAIKALEQQPCEDIIRRKEKALIYFKNLRAIKLEGYSSVFNTAPKDSVVYGAVSAEIEIYDTAIKALEQEPCEDAISRESVIEWLKDKDIIKTKNQEENARRELAELPSVQPTRPTARWIESPNGVYVECSICGSHWEKGFVKHCNMQYCPNCGARMQEVEE